MKKRYFIFIFCVFCCISIFGDTETQEEVDFLLFSANSGSRFENEEKAFIQLNNLAQYILDKNIAPGQIIVYGYAAYAPNEFKSDDLSMERAVTVIEELQKRGVSKELFSDPVGYGAVYLWGNNETENTRKLNRRARVLLDGEIPMPITQELFTAETGPSPIIEENSFIETPATPEIAWNYTPKKSSSGFPLWILFLLAALVVLAVLAFFILPLLLLKRRSQKSVHKAEPVNVQQQITKTVIVPEPEPAKSVTVFTVNLDEEIRFRAYELSQQRRVAGQCDGQDDLRDQDWYNAVREISAWYEACGHSVFTDGGCWWASGTVYNTSAAN